MNPNTLFRSAIWLAVLGGIVLYGSRFAGRAARHVRV